MDDHDCLAAADVGVLIVDDQPPFRAVARTVVGVSGGFTVIGEAESGENGIELALALSPEVVLMDINLPGVSGIEATRRITEDRPRTVVILMSTYDEASLPEAAASCGAARYVRKEDFGPELLGKIWRESVSSRRTP